MKKFTFNVCILETLFLVCVLSQVAPLSDNDIDSFGDSDKLAELLAQVTSIRDQLFSLDRQLTSVQQRFDHMDQRLITLEQHLDHRVDDLKGHLDTLQTNCTAKDNEAPTQAQFRLTRIEKRETAEGFHILVMYEGEAKPAFYVGTNYQEIPNQGTPGSAEFTIPRELQQDDHDLLLVFPDQALAMHLNLSSTALSMDVPPFQFKVRQGSEIQFHRGQDVKFDLSLDVEGDVDAYDYADIHYQIFSQSDSEDNVLVRYRWHPGQYGSDADLITLHTEKKGGSKGHGYISYVLNSTKRDVEGMAQFSLSVTFDCSTNCLVKYLTSFLTVQFYQEDHEGPFPEDFVGFVHNQGENSSVRYCAVNSSHCGIMCTAYGHNLASLGISKVDAAQEEQDRPNSGILYGDFGFAMLGISSVGLEQAGLYQCVAATAEKEIREQWEVRVILPPTIDQALSGVTKLDNGSLLFTCLASGQPAPEVTLSHLSSESLPEPHVTHPSQSETKVEVVVSYADLGGPSDVLCQATNVDLKIAVSPRSDAASSLTNPLVFVQ